MPPEITQLSQEPDPWYRKGWLKALTIVLGTLIILGSVAIAILSVAWNFSQHKALFDAADYAVSNPGKYYVDTGENILDIVANNERYAIAGKFSGLKVDMVIVGNSMYIKTPDPNGLFEALIDQNVRGKLAKIKADLSKSMKNKWVKISLETPPIPSTFLSQINCATDAISLMAHNTSALTQLGYVFDQHKIFDVSSPEKSTYLAEFNPDEVDGFYDDLIQTSTYKELENCAGVITIELFEKLRGGGLEVALTQPTHIASSIEVTKNDKKVATITTDYNDVPRVEVPQDAVSIDQLIIKILDELVE